MFLNYIKILKNDQNQYFWFKLNQDNIAENFILLDEQKIITQHNNNIMTKPVSYSNLIYGDNNIKLQTIECLSNIIINSQLTLEKQPQFTITINNKKIFNVINNKLTIIKGFTPKLYLIKNYCSENKSLLLIKNFTGIYSDELFSWNNSIVTKEWVSQIYNEYGEQNNNGCRISFVQINQIFFGTKRKGLQITVGPNLTSASSNYAEFTFPLDERWNNFTWNKTTAWYVPNKSKYSEIIFNISKSVLTIKIKQGSVYGTGSSNTAYIEYWTE